jgi:hypothetical protein
MVELMNAPTALQRQISVVSCSLPALADISI